MERKDDKPFKRDIIVLISFPILFVSNSFLVNIGKEMSLPGLCTLPCRMCCIEIYHMASLFIQRITSCHKNRVTTCVITLWRVNVTSLTASLSTMHFLMEIKFSLNVIKSHFKRVI